MEQGGSRVSILGTDSGNLHRIEALLKSEISPVGILVFDRSGRITFANAVAETILGLARERITELSYNAPDWHIRDLAGNSIPDEEMPFRRALATGKPVRDQRFVVRPPDGRRVALSVDIAPLHDDHGKLIGAVSFLEDITAAWQAEAALRHEKAFSNAVIQSAPGAFFVLDPEGRLVQWNSYVNRILGLSDEKLSGSSPLAYFHEQDREHIAAKIQEGFAQGYAQAEARVPSQDAGVRLFSFMAQRFQMDSQVYLCGFGMDITEGRQIEDALHQEKIFSETLIQNVPAVFCVLDRQRRLVRWNSNINRLFGATDEQLKGLDALEFVIEEDRAMTDASIQEVFEKGYSQTEMRVRSADRGIRNFAMRCRRVEIGEQPFIVGFGLDVTESKQAAEALQESEARYRSLVTALSEGVVLLDFQGTVQASNASAERLLGIHPGETAKEFPGGPDTEIVREDGAPFPPEMRPPQQTLQTGQPVHNELMGLRKQDGSIKWLSVSAEPLFHARETRPYAAVVSFSDVTDRKLLEQELEHQAQTDPLTGAVNRRHFQELAEREIAQCRRYNHPLTLLMIDIDRFKAVNDNFGHVVGDVVLQEFVRSCHGTLREIDVIARSGGEEFMVLLPETDDQHALQVAERLRQAVSNTEVPVEGRPPVRITVSVGVASVGDTDLETALSHADQALYQAKEKGRNCVCIYRE
jgi:diguanylate cyclase (GGDEF)-like protein/PAS domain S-box-containing protein